MKIRMVQKMLGVALCLSFILPGILIPRQAEAGVPTIIKDAAACIGANWVADQVVDYLGNFLREFAGDLAGGITAVPVSDSTVRNNVRKMNEKERVLDIIARCGARVFFDTEVGGMLNAMRTKGRDGSSTYVQNWRNFQTNADFRGESVFRGILANTRVCPYLQESTNRSFRVNARDRVSLNGQNIRVDNADPYTLRAKCTLPSTFNPQTFAQDFQRAGGWQTYQQLLQPQNNFFGLYLMSLAEQDAQRDLERSNDLVEIIAGGGNTGIRGSSAADSCLVRGSNGTCMFYKNVSTPGSYISAATSAIINNELAWFVNTDELHELVVSVTQRLLLRLLNFSAGESTPSYQGQAMPTYSIRPPPNVPPPPGPSAGPAPSGSTAPPPNPGDCQAEIPAGDPGPFGGDVRGAIEQIAASGSGILSGGSQPYTINNRDAYFDQMISILSANYIVVRDPNLPNQEISIRRPGATTAEQYSIATGGGLTRAAWRATGCPLP